MLGHPKLPPGLIQNCLDVLKEIMPSERDLIRIVVEIIVDLREGDDDGEDDDNQVDVGHPSFNFSISSSPFPSSLQARRSRYYTKYN